MIGGAKNALGKLKVMRAQVAHFYGVRGHHSQGHFEL